LVMEREDLGSSPSTSGKTHEKPGNCWKFLEKLMHCR